MRPPPPLPPTPTTGVSTTPMQLYGATGAQSSILPALDTALGVEHPAKGTPAHLSAYLREMRGYMPRSHRAMLAALAVRVVCVWCARRDAVSWCMRISQPVYALGSQKYISSSLGGPFTAADCGGK